MNHDTIKAKIQSLVPELFELSFGCKFIENDSTQTLIYLGETNSGAVMAYSQTLEDTFTYDFGFGDKSKIEVLGHPIQLQHVLRAIGTKKKIVIEPILGAFLEWKDGNRKGGDYFEALSPDGSRICWDMTKYFDGQTAATKEFIGELLGVK